MIEIMRFNYPLQFVSGFIFFLLREHVYLDITNSSVTSFLDILVIKILMNSAKHP